MSETIDLQELLVEIRSCRACEDLPLGANPVLRAAATARLLIVGQAPGTRVHRTSIPWNDPSGIRLREWLGISAEEFYDEAKVAIVPMAFCYPGKGASGDLAPRAECAKLWRAKLHRALPGIRLTLLVGQYAQRYYLGDRFTGVTTTVLRRKEFLPAFLPLPHPSPRNNLWLRKNPWFEAEVVVELKRQVRAILTPSPTPPRVGQGITIARETA